MEISRVGSKRNHGKTGIVQNIPLISEDPDYDKNNIRWASGKRSIKIKANKICDFDGITHHDYEIELTLKDISALICVLGSTGARTSRKSLAVGLQKSIPSLVRLLACATGVMPLEILDSDDIDTIREDSRFAPQVQVDRTIVPKKASTKKKLAMKVGKRG